eukprot:1191708-Prorocentrum_minimum.AAC.3
MTTGLDDRTDDRTETGLITMRMLSRPTCTMSQKPLFHRFIVPRSGEVSVFKKATCACGRALVREPHGNVIGCLIIQGNLPPE